MNGNSKPLRAFVASGLACALIGLTNTPRAQEPEIITYDTPQRLVCMRNGKVGLERPAAFRLKVVKYRGGEEYSYRDGSYGGRPGSFSINTQQVTCTVTPLESGDYENERVFEGLSEFQCYDGGLLIVRPVFTEKIIERGSENSLMYEYWIADGPPAKLTVALSPQSGLCQIRPLAEDD